MTSPTGSIRPLRFPLYYNADIQSDTPNDPPIDHLTLDGWVTEDSDERVDIVLNLSLNEYIALASCVNVGRDIAYGDNGLYLWWLWVRSLKHMDICDAVLECIETNEDIQDAIAFYSSGSNINGDTTENQALLDSNIIDDPVGCDNDIIYGMTTQLVEFADRLCKDVFEYIEAQQAASVNVGYLIKLIPVLETLPIDEMFELTDKLVDEVEVAYLSASTEQLKIDIACDLFCIAQETCTLTLEQVRDYFEEQSGLVVSYDDVLTFILDFLNGTFTGNVAYYGMNMLFFQILAFGGKFLDYFFQDYLRTISSMFNDPNPDWSTECDDCNPPPDLVFDFLTGTEGFEVYDDGVNPPRGHWSVGVGFTQDWSDTRWRLAIYKDIGTTAIERIDVDMLFNPVGNTHVMNQQNQGETPPPLGTNLESYEITQGGVQTHSFANPYTNDFICFNGANGTAGQMGITDSMTIRGMRVWFQ